MRVNHCPTGSDSGSIERWPGDVITYSGMEPISSTVPDPIPTSPTDVTLNYDATGEVTISGNTTQITVTGTAGESVAFNIPSSGSTITINASSGNDTINVGDLGSFAGTLVAATTRSLFRRSPQP